MQQLQLLCRVAKESPHGPLPTTSRQINTEKRSANTKSTIKAIHGEERGWFYSAQKQLAACTHTPSPLPFLSLHSHRPTPAVYSVAPQPLTTHPPRATGRRHTHTPKRLRDTGKPRGFLTDSPGITPPGPNRDPSRRRALLSPGPSRGRPRPSRPAPRRRYAAAPRQVPPHNGASRPAPLLSASPPRPEATGAAAASGGAGRARAAPERGQGEPRRAAASPRPAPGAARGRGRPPLPALRRLRPPSWERKTRPPPPASSFRRPRARFAARPSPRLGCAAQAPPAPCASAAAPSPARHCPGARRCPAGGSPGGAVRRGEAGSLLPAAGGRSGSVGTVRRTVLVILMLP